MQALKYIELKTGYSDNGPAWIGYVTQSRSGRTVYFNGWALKRMGGRGTSGGNHYNLETGNEYWVSGVKKNGQDRHWAGGGKVLVEVAALSEYLAHVGRSTLDPSLHEVTHAIVATDVGEIERIENTSPSADAPVTTDTGGFQ